MNRIWMGLLLFGAGALSAQERTYKIQPPDEKFIPPDLEHATMIACGVGGEVGGDVKVFVQVNYMPIVRGGRPYSPIIAIRKDATTGLKDCVDWIQGLKVPLEQAQRRLEAEKLRARQQ